MKSDHMTMIINYKNVTLNVTFKFRVTFLK